MSKMMYKIIKDQKNLFPFIGLLLYLTYIKEYNMKEYTYPIAVDDQGNKFQWVENDDVTDCSICCFWKGRCMYYDLNKNKSGICFGAGYFKRI